MATVPYILLGLVGLIGLVAVIWRVGSRRRSVPCPVWLRWLVELDNPFTKTNRAAVIVERLELEPGMAVLDAGCGPGRLAIPIARQVGPQGEVVAMDIQAGMLERAREKAAAANLANIRFLEGGLGEGKLGRNRFDRSVLVTVLGEVPDREAALGEIFDALKPGGILSVTELIFDPHFQPRSRVERLARLAGFRERAFHGNRIAFTLNLQKPDEEQRPPLIPAQAGIQSRTIPESGSGRPRESGEMESHLPARGRARGKVTLRPRFRGDERILPMHVSQGA